MTTTGLASAATPQSISAHPLMAAVKPAVPIATPSYGTGHPLGAADRARYLSSADDKPSRRRATTNCWICWVPSKMSRIFESRAHFSSSVCSE